MLTEINPKLPMRDKAVTREFYLTKMGFEEFGSADFAGYLMVKKDKVQIHFFEFTELDPTENYGQVYIRTDDIDGLYKSLIERKVGIQTGICKPNPGDKKSFRFSTPTTICLLSDSKNLHRNEYFKDTCNCYIVNITAT